MLSDIDECEVACLDPTESCENAPGSYTCNCIDGYYREEPNGDCKEGRKPKSFHFIQIT